MISKSSQKNSDCEHCPSLGKGIFCDLERSALTDVSKQKIANKFKKGQTLFVQGNPPFGLYCISKGNIKVTKSDNQGKETIVRIATAGDVLGHRSIFTDQHYNATATALEDTEVCFIDKKFILNFVRTEPSVAMNLIARVGRDMGAAEDRLASFHQKNVRERLAEFLLLLKESHGVLQEDGKTLLNIKLTREEMASIIGTATETLIRFMSELKDEGLIEQDGKNIFILNDKELVDFANLNY
jgi:CRP-like cAMP-binding protein